MKIRTKAVSLLLTVLLVFGVYAIVPPAAFAEEIIEVTAETDYFTDGNTYRVSQDVTNDKRIRMQGSAVLTLDEGVTLTLNKGIQVSENNSLTIRGAGKQHGVPWFGNVSVFNRWGWKAYPKEYDADPLKKGPGPDKGTSLALMKKLMYEQIFYNSVAVGFESSCYWNGDQLSPVGRIQQGAVDWSARHGDPGVMHVPVALMVDFYSGWSFPRHLYSGQVYKVWGTLPYEAGDYLTDGVLDMLYPGYQMCGKIRITYSDFMPGCYIYARMRLRD